MLTYKLGTAAFAADADSLFIPASALSSYGLTTGQCTNNISGFCSFMWAMMKRLASTTEGIASLASVLDISTISQTSALNSNTNGVITVTDTFSGSFQQLNDAVQNDNPSPTPLPVTGTNTGVGDFALTDVLPGMTTVNSGANTSGAGMVITTASLVEQDADIVHANLDFTSGEDNRREFIAMMKALALGAPTRSTTVVSAVTSTSLGAQTISTVPASYTTLPNPLSGISADDVSSRKVFRTSQSFSISLQWTRDVTNQVSLNVV